MGSVTFLKVPINSYWPIQGLLLQQPSNLCLRQNLLCENTPKIVTSTHLARTFKLRCLQNYWLYYVHQGPIQIFSTCKTIFVETCSFADCIGILINLKNQKLENCNFFWFSANFQPSVHHNFRLDYNQHGTSRHCFTSRRSFDWSTNKFASCICVLIGRPGQRLRLVIEFPWWSIAFFATKTEWILCNKFSEAVLRMSFFKWTHFQKGHHQVCVFHGTHKKPRIPKFLEVISVLILRIFQTYFLLLTTGCISSIKFWS